MHHQETALQQAVPELMKKEARRAHRAATQGFPGSKLKTGFDFLVLLAVTQPRAPPTPWDAQLPAHGADALVVVTWFMLCEIKSASAKVGDISVSLRVTLQIPIHKTAQGGDTLLTVRTQSTWGGQSRLLTACGVDTRLTTAQHDVVGHAANVTERALPTVQGRWGWGGGGGGGVWGVGGCWQAADLALRN